MIRFIRRIWWYKGVRKARKELILAQKQEPVYRGLEYEKAKRGEL